MNRVLRAATATTAALAGLSVVSPPAALANQLLSETFAGASTSPGVWSMVSPAGAHTPCLTAAATKPADGSLPWCNAVRDGKAQADPVGQGVFQLTDNSTNDAGALLLNQSIPTRSGLHISFDQFQFRTSTPRGADGIAFFLIDGAKAATIGENGGRLGYKGIDGAFVGLGLDEFGNFSNPAYWGTPTHKDASPGPRPNSVVLRGSQSSQYQYIKGVQLPDTERLAVDRATTRDAALRTVTVDLSTQNVLNVRVDFNDGRGPQLIMENVDLDHLPGQPALPSTIKMGFAASTGASTNYHEIRNFKVSTLDPDLAVKVAAAAPFQAGGTGTFNVTLSNGVDAGPTVGRVTTTFTVPDGLTYQSATGTGWTCGADGRRVTCIRPANGPDALAPGTAYPPIQVNVGIPASASGSVTALATANTMNERHLDDNTGTTTVPIIALPPDVSVVVAPDGPFQAGKDGTVSAVVSDAKGAGPATGPTSVVIQTPAGTTIKDVPGGDGWTCTKAVDGASVTCTRPDVLQPGASFPPAVVVYTIPPSAGGGSEPLAATAVTPNDAHAADNTATATVPVAPPPPDVSVVVAPDGPFQAGKDGTVSAVVSDAKGAGPATGPTSVVIQTPAGTTIKDVPGGDGWTCTKAVDGASVTCTRPDILQPGASFPPAVVVYTIPATAGRTIGLSASASTPDDANPANDSDAATVAVAPAGPDLAVTIGGTPACAKCGIGAVTAVVSNAANAGPTTGTVTATITVPPGESVTAISAVGWTCAPDRAKAVVTCTRPGSAADTLKPGMSYPKITVATTVPAAIAAAKVATDGEVNSLDNSAAELLGVAMRQMPLLAS